MINALRLRARIESDKGINVSAAIRSDGDIMRNFTAKKSINLYAAIVEPKQCHGHFRSLTKRQGNNHYIIYNKNRTFDFQ